MINKKFSSNKTMIEARGGSVIKDVHQQIINIGPSVSTPFQAPPLPPYFVQRPEFSEIIKSDLLSNKVVGSGILVVSAIHGLGGVGKSTIAAALAHDAEVQERFPDGILWATLGQQPVLLSLLSGWIQALGDYYYKPYAVEPAKSHLITLLHGKAVLLVIDDVWNSQHANAFLVGGPNCRVIITTRESIISDSVGAITHNLDVMTRDQALALIESRLRVLSRIEKENALSIAQAVGFLPLALELAAAQISDGVTWDDLLMDLCAEIAQLERLDLPGAQDETDETARKRLSLLASFNLSLKRLPENLQKDFAWLGLLPEDVTLTPKMVSVLWDLNDEVSARDRLRYLRNKALLLPGASLADGTITCRSHDLLHDLSCRLLTSSPTPVRVDDLPGLGLSLSDAHGALLERYKNRTQNGRWSTLPDDGYIHTHLVLHMEKAEWIDEIHSLLFEETMQGRNAWYDARERIGQTSGFLEDINRAWALAKLSSNETKIEESIKYVNLEIRYALIMASLNSLAKNILPELLASLVKKKLWTPSEGLTYARQVPDPGQRWNALIGLVQFLTGSLKEEALKDAIEAATLMESSINRNDALMKMAFSLAEEGQVSEALQVALRTDQKTSEKDYDLGALAYRLAELDESSNALSAAFAIREDQRRIATLRHLANSGNLKKSWEAVLSLSDTSWETKLGMQLVDTDSPLQLITECLSPDQASKLKIPLALRLAEFGCSSDALQLVLGIHDRDQQDAVLAEVAVRLAKCNCFEDSFNAAVEIKNHELQKYLLLRLTLYFPKASTQKALQIIMESHSIQPNANNVNLFQSAYGLIQAVQPLQYRAEALAGLSLHLGDPLNETALLESFKCAEELGVEEIIEILIGLAGKLESETLLRRIFQAMESISKSQQFLEVLAAYIPYLRESFYLPMLNLIFYSQDRIDRTDVLLTFILNVSKSSRDNILQELLEGSRKIIPRSERNRFLMELAYQVAMGGDYNEALLVLGKISSREIKAKTLIKLLKIKPSELKGDIVARIFRMLHSMPEESKAEILENLVSYLPHSLVEKTIGILQKVKSPLLRIKVFITLLPIIAEPLQKKVLNEVYDSIWRVVDLEDLIEAIKISFSYFQEDIRKEVLDDALKSVLEIDEYDNKIESLAVLLPYLQESTINELLHQVLEDREAELEELEELEAEERTMYVEAQIGVLEVLIPYLSEPMLMVVLERFRTIGDEWKLACALMRIAPNLIEVPLVEFLERLEAFNDVYKRETVRLVLLPSLVMHGHCEDAINLAKALEEDDRDSEALTEVAIHLSQSRFISESIKPLLEIQNGWRRAAAFAELIPLLKGLEQKEAVRHLWKMVERGGFIDFEMAYIPDVSNSVLEEAATAVRAIESDYWRERALIKMIPALAKSGHRLMAFNLALELVDSDKRLKLLVTLLPEIKKCGLIRHAIDIVESLDDASKKVETLEILTPFVPTMLMQKVFDIAKSILGEEYKSSALGILAPYLSQNLILQALELARQINWESARLTALRNLAPYLPSPMQNKVLKEFPQIGVILGDEVHYSKRRAKRDTQTQPVSSKQSTPQRVIKELYQSKEPEGRTKLEIALDCIKSKDLKRLVELIMGTEAPEQIYLMMRLTKQFEVLPFADRFSMWREAIQTLGTKTREELLDQMELLSYLVVPHGNRKILDEIGNTIQIVGRWWR